MMLSVAVIVPVLFVFGPIYVVSGAVTWDETRDCPFPKTRCQCINEFEIDCSGRALSSVPMSHYSPWSYKVINLKNNFISRIHRFDFININASEVLLDETHINDIEDGAFNGIRNDLKMLNLANNDLTFFPPELGTLHNLESLDLRGKNIPILGLTELIMRLMGKCHVYI